MWTTSSSSADLHHVERERPTSPQVTAELPVIQFNKLHIQSQKEFIKLTGLNALLIADYHQKLDTYCKIRDKKMMLLVKIESTKDKYLPDNASRHMHRQWWR